MLLVFTITPDQRTPKERLPGATESVMSLLGMQGFAVTRIEHTHQKGLSAVIVHLGRTGRG